MELGDGNALGRERNFGQGAHASASYDARSTGGTDKPHAEHYGQHMTIRSQQRFFLGYIQP